MAKIQAVVLDVEGTTTPISFVVDVLFPFIRREVRKYLTENWEKEEVKQDVEALRAQNEEDVKNSLNFAQILSNEKSKEDIIDSIVKNVESQMDVDRKIGALKQLQGHMWVSGYQSGELLGAVYDDVPVALQKWKENKTPVYVYSSGSVAAQKLLFGHSSAGNLLDYFVGNFDTGVGLKIESESYKNISNNIGVAPENILFVTDSIKEIVAAQAVGIVNRLSIRPGNPPVPEDHPYTAITTFDDLFNGTLVFVSKQ